MSEKITSSRWIELKQKVKNEMSRRNRGSGPVDEYAGAAYDYSSTPASKTKINKEVYTKNIIPLAAVNPDSLPANRDGNIKINLLDLQAMETLVATLATINNSPSTSGNGGCKVGCTGFCQAQCHGSCSNSCTGSCSGTCKTTCTNSCKGGCDGCSGSCFGVCRDSCSRSCTGDCDGTCSGTCDSTCRGSCFSTCASGCYGSDCTGGCSRGCQGDNGSFCACCYNKTSSSGGTAKGPVSAGYIWYTNLIV